MGMYNELNKISQSIITSKQAKQQIREQQQFEKELQKEILQIMQEQLIYEAKNSNIYDDRIKEYIINESIDEYIAGIKNAAWRNRFMNKYRKNIQLFLNQNYFTVAGRAERIEKKQNNTSWRENLAIQKFEYQKQKDQQKLNQQKQIEAEKIKQLRRQQVTQTLTTLFEISIKVLLFTCKIGLYLMAIPFYVGFFFLTGFVSGICKNK